MSGFEMSPFGPVPIGTPSLKDASPEYAAQFVVMRGEPTTPFAPQIPVVRQQIPAPASLEPIKRGSLIQQVRARIREIKAELKHLGALQTELQELERLLQAAKQKPKASVRPLRSVG